MTTNLHEQNKAKIKPCTKIRILSPEHSKYVQELAFEAGVVWLPNWKEPKYLDKRFLYVDEDKVMTYGQVEMTFDLSDNKEIQIDIAPTPYEINARVLAEKVNASDVLSQGAKHLSDRATTYDTPEGERSMGATVEAFESITGHALTEEQGWLFMVLLKAVRSQQGNFKQDNYEDGAAYFALACESASEVRK